MLVRWTLENFKSFRQRRDLPLAPLTLLCGANSSGKSTIIQSILLIKQTLQHAPASRAVALNGPLVRLGAFSDIENFESSNDLTTDHVVGIGWELDTRSFSYSGSYRNLVRYMSHEVGRIQLDFELGSVSGGESESAGLHPRLMKSTISAKYVDSDGDEQSVLVKIRRGTGRGRRVQYQTALLADVSAAQDMRVEQLDDDTKTQAVEGRPDGRVVGCLTQNMFPAYFAIRFDRGRLKAEELSRQITGERRHNPTREVSDDFLMPKDLAQLLSDLIRSGSWGESRSEELNQLLLGDGHNRNLTVVSFIRKLYSLHPSTRRTLTQNFQQKRLGIVRALYSHIGKELVLTRTRPMSLSEAREANVAFFRFALRYLGPLRDEPKPLYPLQALPDPTDVGPKGELTAAVLHLNARRTIEYVPSAAFNSDQIAAGVVNASLSEAVTDWLKYLGVAVGVETSERGKFGHELRICVNPASGYQDLTNVGVGVSQVLPIVVTCLLAERGTTVILEQPELHLHPAVQARLADFFISMNLAGKQCIIETHGEHLVERLRFRVAGDIADRIREDTKIYFLRQEGGETTCRDVELTRYGAIEDWPDDFFDQSQKESERIVLTALEKRRRELSGGKE